MELTRPGPMLQIHQEIQNMYTVEICRTCIQWMRSVFKDYKQCTSMNYQILIDVLGSCLTSPKMRSWHHLLILPDTHSFIIDIPKGWDDVGAYDPLGSGKNRWRKQQYNDNVQSIGLSCNRLLHWLYCKSYLTDPYSSQTRPAWSEHTGRAVTPHPSTNHDICKLQVYKCLKWSLRHDITEVPTSVNSAVYIWQMLIKHFLWEY